MNLNMKEMQYDLLRNAPEMLSKMLNRTELGLVSKDQDAVHIDS